MFLMLGEKIEMWSHHPPLLLWSGTQTTRAALKRHCNVIAKSAVLDYKAPWLFCQLHISSGLTTLSTGHDGGDGVITDRGQMFRLSTSAFLGFVLEKH